MATRKLVFALTLASVIIVTSIFLYTREVGDPATSSPVARNGINAPSSDLVTATPPAGASRLEGHLITDAAVSQQQQLPEDKQIQRLEWELQNFRNSRSIQSARAVLCREALIVLHDQKQYVLQDNEYLREEEKPGHYLVTRSSELGTQLFYIPAEDYPEYDQVVRMDVEGQETGRSPALSAELEKRIISRVNRTLRMFGGTEQ